jgi:hypothetical protein
MKQKFGFGGGDAKVGRQVNRHGRRAALARRPRRYRHRLAAKQSKYLLRLVDRSSGRRQIDVNVTASCDSIKLATNHGFIDLIITTDGAMKFDHLNARSEHPIDDNGLLRGGRR